MHPVRRECGWDSWDDRNIHEIQRREWLDSIRRKKNRSRF